jgi:hypothetical protein
MRWLCITILLGGYIGIHASLATATNNSDRAKVIKAVATLFDAAASDDLDKFHAVAAPTFYAFDNGRRFDGDALMLFIGKLHAGGNVYEWHVTEPEVQISGGAAWITYVNKGSIQTASGKTNMTWLESAVLRKEHGAWHIVFFHSTRAS